jgi:hypothetical protein
MQGCDDNLDVEHGHEHADTHGDEGGPALEGGEMKMRIGVLALIHGCRQCGRCAMALLGAYVFCLWMVANDAKAVNWEGHENFFHEAVPITELTEGVAAPLLKPMPTCEAMAERHKANTYEQVPIEGENCIGALQNLPVKK